MLQPPGPPLTSHLVLFLNSDDPVGCSDNPPALKAPDQQQRLGENKDISYGTSEADAKVSA